VAQRMHQSVLRLTEKDARLNGSAVKSVFII